jgi:hypothetical protein
VAVGGSGPLGYAPHLVLSCTPVEKSSTPAEKDLLVHTFSGFPIAIRGTSTVSVSVSVDFLNIDL